MIRLSMFANCQLSLIEVRIPPCFLPQETGALNFLIITFQRDSSQVLEKDFHGL